MSQCQRGCSEERIGLFEVPQSEYRIRPGESTADAKCTLHAFVLPAAASIRYLIGRTVELTALAFFARGGLEVVANADLPGEPVDKGNEIEPRSG